MKRYLFTAFFFLFLGEGCKKEPPVEPPPPPTHQKTMYLTVEDVSCTEAWLKVSLTDLNDPRTIAITQDGQIKITSRIAGADSVFLLENLLPHRSYRFAAQRMRDTTVTDTSGTVLAATLDSTSHNFSWQIDTLGDGNSSELNDVAVVNDTLAYAVGEIYKRDSVGNWDPNAYNLVKWNGNTWKLKRIPFIGPCSAVDYPPLTAIWAFSANHILVTNGGAIVRYDGTHAVLDCGMNSLLAGAINKLYATNPQDVYLVGNAGTIAHYDGVRWRRIESGTTLPINDVFGVSKAGTTEVYAVAARLDQNEGRKILKIGASSVTMLPDSGASWNLRGIWFTQRGPYYVVGAGLHYKQDVSSSTPWNHYPPGEVTNYYSQAIRGSARNDVVVVGDFGEIVHFNGMTWKNYLSQTRINGSYYGVSIKGNIIIAVGQVQNRGVVAVGRR
jgi:hypothetical protein